jgi:rhodanese-related sulfurtransferase
MKTNYFLRLLIVLFVILPFTGCKGKKEKINSDAVPEVKRTIIPGNETSLLLKGLQTSGDYINSKEFPSLIRASIVNESLGKNILVIDLRPSSLFSEGHIKKAVNKRFQELPVYFETGIRPFEYDKIILVCDDGQISSYATCLLRLKGYGNVYAMRWGMSAWNKKYAESGWLKNVSGRYENNLEKKINEQPAAKGMPDLKTGLRNGEEISEARIRKLFEEGTGSILISADEVFKDPQRYIIINLDRRDKYEDGHIPGAIRYKPESTLGFIDEMATIPSDKTVVLYCGTGHNSGFATAYLRLFGYDARTLKYGNNGFMHDKMVTQRAALSWLPFTLAEVNDFEVVK